MDYGSLPLMKMMQNHMRYSGQRQAVIAQNIANADTPDYRAQDVKAPDFGAMAAAGGKLPLARTDPAHMTGGNAGGGAFRTFARAHTFETTPTGNNVAIDEEVQRMSLNQSDYQRTAALYRKTIDLFKTAVGRPSGG